MNKRFSTFTLMLPVTISFLLLAAHFMRESNRILFSLTLFVLVVVLLVHEPLIAKIAQVSLVLGAIEWVGTGLFFVGLRMQSNRPWIRLAIIIGVVACFTFASGLVFFTDPLKKKYKISKK